MAFSVSVIRLVQYDLSGFCIMYCIPWSSSASSFLVNFMFVELMVQG